MVEKLETDHLDLLCGWRKSRRTPWIVRYRLAWQIG